VSAGKVGDVQRDEGERRDLRLLPLREKAIGDVAHVEDFDGA
jgi:hypothetical protein